jgi:hypothetical protein
MEPPSDTISYCAMVAKVEEKFTYHHRSGVGASAEFEEQSLGWFILYEGSGEYLYVGQTPPPFSPGDVVEITQRKVPHAKSLEAASQPVREAPSDRGLQDRQDRKPR